MFNILVYKNICGFVSREAQDVIFHELKRIDNIGTNSFACGYTLRVTHDLPYGCEHARFINIYGFMPLKYIHVYWKMLLICSSYDAGDSWGLNSDT